VTFPTIAGGGTQATLQLRATDSGGNVTLPPVFNVELKANSIASKKPRTLREVNLKGDARSFAQSTVEPKKVGWTGSCRRPATVRSSRRDRR